jgi:hypothetical protein
MKTNERWHCTNPACCCEILVEVGGEIEGKNPRCACSGLMKKKYSPPVLTYLDFLRVDDLIVLGRGSHEINL